MNRRWICNDVWMDIFPSFDRPQLGLKLALLSPRFNALVDKHFGGKSELTIWRTIKTSHTDSGTKPKLSVWFDDGFAEFPLPDRPLPSKIRFKRLKIMYIDHSVITFLRSNQHIFDKRGTDLHLMWTRSPLIKDDHQPIWDIFVNQLDNLLRLISPTILTDLVNLNSINSFDRFPAAIGDDFDGPNSTISAGQALSKWLHSPRKDSQPKRLRCDYYSKQTNFDWVNNFKEHFLRANAISSVSYEIHFLREPSMPIVPFELVNEWTKEKLTLAKENENYSEIWIMKRCKIIRETAAIQQQKKKDENRDDLNDVLFWVFCSTNCIGPLSPSPEEEEKAGQSITNGPSSSEK